MLKGGKIASKSCRVGDTCFIRIPRGASVHVICGFQTHTFFEMLAGVCVHKVYFQTSVNDNWGTGFKIKLTCTWISC